MGIELNFTVLELTLVESLTNESLVCSILVELV
jgi:hypothetical protein